MKKKILSAILFLIVFAAAYGILSFAIPGMRIKLEAAPMVYFVESIRHMAFFKALVSGVVAAIAAWITLFAKR